jgi:dATP pyrophosphohydrolase
MLTGKMEEGETVVQTVLREITEETALQTSTIFSLNYVSRFFEQQDESIYMVPLFLAVVPHSARVKLNPQEHDKYKWCNFQEALRYLTWNQHRKALLHIRREFLEREPNQHLKMYDVNAEQPTAIDTP